MFKKREKTTCLVAGETARSDGLGVVTSAVESSSGPEVNEVDQRLATLAARETGHVPRGCTIIYRSVCTNCYVTRHHHFSTLKTYAPHNVKSDDNTTTNNNIISKTMFMVLSSRQSHCESSPGSFDECRTAPSGRRPKTKPDDLGCESACTGCQKLHPPPPFYYYYSARKLILILPSHRG